MSGRAGFTDFALDLYGSAGVSPACLLLQERRAVDVNLVLFAAYVGAHRGRPLSAAELAGVAASVRPWQDEVVVPLRRVRRRLADRPEPAPTAATTALRDRITGVELDAEMIELEQLRGHAEALVDDGPRDTPSAGERTSAAIDLALGGAGPAADERAAVDVIASAAVELAGRGTS